MFSTSPTTYKFQGCPASFIVMKCLSSWIPHSDRIILPRWSTQARLRARWRWDAVVQNSFTTLKECSSINSSHAKKNWLFSSFCVSRMFPQKKSELLTVHLVLISTLTCAFTLGIKSCNKRKWNNKINKPVYMRGPGCHKTASGNIPTGNTRVLADRLIDHNANSRVITTFLLSLNQ